jgi:hypothetical protein
MNFAGESVNWKMATFWEGWPTSWMEPETNRLAATGNAAPEGDARYKRLSIGLKASQCHTWSKPYHPNSAREPDQEKWLVYDSHEVFVWHMEEPLFEHFELASNDRSHYRIEKLLLWSRLLPGVEIISLDVIRLRTVTKADWWKIL